jgi:hypothetical protein
VLFHSGSFNSAVFGFSFSRLVPAFAFSALRSIRRAAFFCFFSRRAISFCRFLNVSLAITPPFLARSHCYVTRLAFFLSFCFLRFCMPRAWSTCSSAAPFVAPVTSKISQTNIVLAPAAPTNNAQPEFFAHLFSFAATIQSSNHAAEAQLLYPGELPKRIEADT